jgi:hypothetical protein
VQRLRELRAQVEGLERAQQVARVAAEAKAALIRVEALRDAALVRVRELTLAPVPAGAVFRMDGAGTAECNGFYKRNGTRPLARPPYR